MLRWLPTSATAFLVLLAVLLGPAGWLWNTIYDLVFQQNAVTMAIFGWELFCAPVILVYSAAWVMTGSGATLRKPPLPVSSEAETGR